MSAVPPTEGPPTLGQVSAALTGGGGPLSFTGQSIPIGETAAEVVAFFQHMLESSELADILGLSSMTALPAVPVPVPLPTLDRMVLEALEYVPATATEDRELSLVVSWDTSHAVHFSGPAGMTFALSKLRAAVDLRDTGPTATLEAHMVFDGHLDLDVRVQLPALIFEASLADADADVSEDDAQKRKDAVARYALRGGGAADGPGPSAGPGLTLGGLQLMLAPKAERALVHLEVDDLFAFGPFTLEAVGVDMVFDGTTDQVSGLLWADLGIGGSPDHPLVTLALGAERSQEGDWDLQGSLVSGTPTLADLLTALEGHFEMSTPFDLPDVLTGLTVVDLTLAYDTKDRQFAFSVGVELEVEQTKVTVTLLIEKAGSTGASVSASLRVGPHEFTIDYESGGASGEGAGSSLVGFYETAAGGDRPDLGSLVGELVPDLAPGLPSVTVPKAIVGTLSTGKPATRSWLFGAELGIGVDVSVEVPDVGIPQLHQLFSGDVGLGIASFQVLVATKPIKGPDLARLPHVDAFTLPVGDLDEVCLSAPIRIGAVTHPLMVQLGGETQVTVGGGAPATAPDRGPGTGAPAASEPPPAGGLAATADAAPGAGSDITWVPLHAQLGPLTLDKVGARYHDGRLKLLVDASLTAAGLTLSLDGLSIETPVDGFHPTFGLTGLGLAYDTGSVEVSGTFLRNGDEYSGAASIKTAKWTLSAFGSYASVNGSPSVFAYAFLDSPLGGPSFCFVTGVAAGFGYHRSLTIPAVDQLPAFPLVSAVMGPAPGAPAAAPADATSPEERTAEALRSLDRYIQPDLDQSWLAVGLRFTSFEVVHSFALLTVSFGSTTEIDLLGLSSVTMPTKLEEGHDPIGFAQLALRVSFTPASGVLAARGVLTPDSFILSRDCHLTGGFAFDAWFKDDGPAKAGEFVLTLGGYHPRFAKPAHYPEVAPIAFTWTVGDLTVKGGLYFALTPRAVMAGGFLDAVWSSGDISAWFQASVDFLLSWKPFHYDISASIHIGASFRVNLWFTSFTMTIDVGVDLQLAGPPFGGTATVDLSVVHFTIPFGSSGSARVPITWEAFRQSFLPPVVTSPPEGPGAPVVAGSSLPVAVRGTGDPIRTDSYCTAQVTGGLLRDLTGVPGDPPDDPPRWVVSRDRFELTVECVIPPTAATFYPVRSADATATSLLATPPPPVDVGPVDLAGEHFVSELFVIVADLEDESYDFSDRVTWTPVRGSAPKALWDVDAAMGTTAGSIDAINGDGDGGLVDVIKGFTFAAKPAVPDRTLAVDVAAVQAEQGPETSGVCWAKPDPAVCGLGIA